MLHDREGVVVVVQKFPPPLVLRGTTKAFRMRLERIPPNIQQVSIRIFYAAPKFMLLIANGLRNERLCLTEVTFKVFRLAWTHVQDRHFKNHLRSPPYI